MIPFLDLSKASPSSPRRRTLPGWAQSRRSSQQLMGRGFIYLIAPFILFSVNLLSLPQKCGENAEFSFPTSMTLVFCYSHDVIHWHPVGRKKDQGRLHLNLRCRKFWRVQNDSCLCWLLLCRKFQHMLVVLTGTARVAPHHKFQRMIQWHCLVPKNFAKFFRFFVISNL